MAYSDKSKNSRVIQQIALDALQIAAEHHSDIKCNSHLHFYVQQWEAKLSGKTHTENWPIHLIYTQWLPPAVQIARAKTKHA